MNKGLVIVMGGLLAIGLLFGIYVFSNLTENPFEPKIVVEEAIEEEVVEEVIIVEEISDDRVNPEPSEPLKLQYAYLLKETLSEAEIDEDGNLVLSGEVRYRFNEFCNDYWMRFVPNVDEYDFEYQGAAIWYMFSLWERTEGLFPEKLSAEEIERSIQELFSYDRKDFPSLEHRTYTKYVKYEDGYYSVYPEGLGADTFFYNPVQIHVEKMKAGLLVQATIDEYSFMLDRGYELLEQDLLLKQEANRLGLSMDTAALYLLEKNQMEIFEPRERMVLEMFIDMNSIPHILMFNDGEETYRLD